MGRESHSQILRIALLLSAVLAVGLAIYASYRNALVAPPAEVQAPGPEAVKPRPRPDEPPAQAAMLNYALWAVPKPVLEQFIAADADARFDHAFTSDLLVDFDRYGVFLNGWPDIANFPLAEPLQIDTAAISANAPDMLVMTLTLKLDGREGALQMLLINRPAFLRRDPACYGPLLRDLLLIDSWTGPPEIDIDQYANCSAPVQ